MLLPHENIMLPRFYMKYFYVLTFCWCCLQLVKGEILCTNQLLRSINVSTVMQSDILLPCNFNSTLFGSDKTADISVVWSQKNSFYSNLVEITAQGESKFWYNKGGRIVTFPEHAESGNFSILIRKVNESDLDLYSCKLYEGNSCSIAYQELRLGHAANQKYIIAGALGGAGLLFLLVSSVCYIFYKRNHQKRPEISCEHTIVNAVYDSVTVPKSNDIDALVCENPIYATAGNLERYSTVQ